MSTATHERYSGVFTPTAATTPSSYTVVSPGFETSTLLSTLSSTPLSDIGSNKFMEAYCINLERLSIQAHLTAGSVCEEAAVNVLGGSGGESSEYIVDAFLEEAGKVEELVRTLLAIEYWRSNVLFRQRSDDDYAELNEADGGNDEMELAERLAENGNSLRAAFILHAETTIVAMLNLIFYKGVPPALLGSGDEVLLALIDYCARQLAFLGTPESSNASIRKQKNPLPPSKLASHLSSRSRLSEIRDSVHDSTYQTAVAAVALSRYLCENIEEFGPSLVGRILEVHDFPLLMVPLVEEPPWTRRRRREKDGAMIWEKLNEHNEWSVPSDLLRLTKLEGQPWLALYHLTTSKVCREAYGLDEFRKTNLMKLRKYLHKGLLDQVPVLEEVARYLDELSIMGVPPSGQGVRRGSSNASSSGLLMQRVDSLRESIVGKKQLNDVGFWNGIVEAQWDGIFSSVTDAQDHMLRRIGSEIYGGSGLDEDVVTTADVIGTAPRDDDSNWKPAISRQLEKVVLSLHNGDETITVFELAVAEESFIITDTPFGKYRRIKLKPQLVSGETEAIFPNAKVEAIVQFTSTSQSDQGSELSQSSDSLALPTIQPNSTPNSYEELGIVLPEHFPPKEWRQLGDLQGRSVVLQLGFKRMDCGIIPAGCTYLRGYKLLNAFLSEPVVG